MRRRLLFVIKDHILQIKEVIPALMQSRLTPVRYFIMFFLIPFFKFKLLAYFLV